MIFEFGHQKVDIDVERTRQFYASAGGMDCNCVNCTNFAKAVDILPESFKSVFSQLGIDMKKTPECYLNTMNQDGTLCYGGLYHVCGSIIEGVVSAEEINHNGFPYYSVLPDLKICYINEIALLAETLSLTICNVLPARFSCGQSISWLLTMRPILITG